MTQFNLNLNLGSIVRKVDNAIHWTNRFPLDSTVHFVNSYPLDSDLSVPYRYPPLNNWAQKSDEHISQCNFSP